MLLLRLIAFVLSATQRLSSWRWPARKQAENPVSNKHETSSSCSDSSDMQTSNCKPAHDFLAFYDEHSKKIYCYSISQDLYWSYQGGHQRLSQIAKDLDQERDVDVAPDCLIDPDSTVKGIPSSWGRSPW